MEKRAFIGIYRDSYKNLKGKERIVLLTILSECNHTDNPDFIFNNKRMPLKRGQWVSSRKKLIELTDLSDRQLRTAIKNLKNTTNLKTSNLSNHGTLYTIENIDFFLIDSNNATNQETNQETNGRPTGDQRVTINNNDNNDNKDNNENKKKVEYPTIIEGFNKIAGENKLAGIKSLTDERKKHIKTILSEHKLSPEQFLKIISERVEESDFLKGNNGRGWVADFDFIIKPKNFLKIMEGGYKGKTKIVKYNGITGKYEEVYE